MKLALIILLQLGHICYWLVEWCWLQKNVKIWIVSHEHCAALQMRETRQRLLGWRSPPHCHLWGVLSWEQMVLVCPPNRSMLQCHLCKCPFFSPLHMCRLCLPGVGFMLSLKVRWSFSLHGKSRCMSIVSFLVDSVFLFEYLYLLNMKPPSSLSLLTGSRNATSALHTFS